MQRRLDAVDGWMAALVVTWGTAFVAIKELGHVLDPYQLTWYRYLPFLAIFGVWLLLRRRDRFRLLDLRDGLLFMLLGLLGVIGYHFPLNWGLQPDSAGLEVSGATGAILVATTPLWTVLFTTIGGQERFDRRKAFGSAIAFAGVAVVVLLGRGPGTEFTVAAKAAVILLAPICWSLFSVLGKPLVHKYGGLFFTGFTMSLGTLVLLPYGIQQGVAPLVGLTGMQWFWLIYISMMATVAGYAVWNWALKIRSATELTAYIYFVPVVATVAGLLILREPVTPWFLLGAALVLWGVIQVNRARAVPAPAGVPAPVENP